MIKYLPFNKALNTLGILEFSTKKELKTKYLALSKKYHPDKENGDTAKFQAINEAYKIVNDYMNNFKFRLNKAEFEEQYPFADSDGSEWFKSYF